MRTKILFITLSLSLLSACTFQQVGTTLGGVVGNHIGGRIGSDMGNSLSRTLVSTTGTMVGAWLGSEFGKKLDAESYRRMEKNAQETLENRVDGDVGYWDNDDNDARGSIQINRTVYVEELKTTCREYKETVEVGSKEKSKEATACRNKNGVWKDKS